MVLCQKLSSNRSWPRRAQPHFPFVAPHCPITQHGYLAFLHRVRRGPDISAEGCCVLGHTSSNGSMVRHGRPRFAQQRACHPNAVPDGSGNVFVVLPRRHQAGTVGDSGAGGARLSNPSDRPPACLLPCVLGSEAVGNPKAEKSRWVW